jgi:methionyl-tRNA formyltransferase
MGDNEKIDFRILFMTQDDPFYVRLFFEEFFRVYEHLDEIVGVVVAQAMGKKSLSMLAQQMYGFYGPVDFLKMALKYASYKSLAIATPGFLRINGRYGLTQLCKVHAITVLHRDDINSLSFLNELKAMNLDLIISVAAPAIFKSDLIRLPKFGCINIHNAKLPKYRGMMPNFWQMYYDERTVGITIHEINVRIDQGRIILQKEIDIHANETLDSLIKRTKRMGAHFMIEAIDMIKSGNVKYLQNLAAEGSYFSFPTREDVKEFKRRGKRIM